MNGFYKREVGHVESEVIGTATGNTYLYIKNNKTGEHTTIGGEQALKMIGQQVELALMLKKNNSNE